MRLYYAHTFKYQQMMIQKVHNEESNVCKQSTFKFGDFMLYPWTKYLIKINIKVKIKLFMLMNIQNITVDRYIQFILIKCMYIIYIMYCVHIVCLNILLTHILYYTLSSCDCLRKASSRQIHVLQYISYFDIVMDVYVVLFHIQLCAIYTFSFIHSYLVTLTTHFTCQTSHPAHFYCSPSLKTNMK